MLKSWKTVLTSVAFAGAIAVSALHAYADDAKTSPSAGAMMGGQGDMSGMTNMMGQMNQMMEGCSAMMKDMKQQPSGETPKAAEKPSVKR